VIIAAIPARSGSKGIPDKNIAPLGGKPLLVWTIEAAWKVPEITHIVVSTDSFPYGSLATKHNAFYLYRPEEFCQDDSPDVEWVKHLLSHGPYGNASLIIHLRPTTPLRDPRLISQAIKRIQDTPGATSLRSVHEMSETAFKCFTMDLDCDGKYLLPILRYGYPRDPNDPEKWLPHGPDAPRQFYPKTYHPNGYVDILRVSHILEHGELYGDKILAFETPRVTEIDTPEDLEYVRWQVERTRRS
jgi:CMP-N-acetylneuraminic acid synthetase